MTCCRKYQPNKAGKKLDNSKQRKHRLQRENGDTQDDDLSNEDVGGCNVVKDQPTVISVPHTSNTNGDLPQDYTQNNIATTSNHFGSHVIHRANKTMMPPSISSLLTYEPRDAGIVDVTSEVPPQKSG